MKKKRNHLQQQREEHKNGVETLTHQKLNDSGGDGDIDAVRDQLDEGMLQATGADSAVAAVQPNGSDVNWGSTGDDGDSSAMRDQLTKGALQVASSGKRTRNQRRRAAAAAAGGGGKSSFLEKFDNDGYYKPNAYDIGSRG